MTQKYFKNDNLHLKLEADELDKNITFYFIYEASDSIRELYRVSEVYNISNYEIACIFQYNGGMQYYEISSRDLEKLSNGKTVFLKALKYDSIKDLIYKEWTRQ